MAKNAEFRLEATITEKEFLQFRDDFRRDIIRNGFDDIITQSVIQLKTELKFVVNEQIRSTTGGTLGAPTPSKTNELGQPSINPPKSEEEILKFLTNGKTDLSKYNKAKDYSTLSETGVVFGQKSRGMDRANRVALRMNIDEGETVQGQFSKAKQFFQDSVFALPDAGGNVKYYANPGLDITGFVKIKCSTLTGDGDAQPFEGMSPAQRFQRDRHRKGYADWTLKQDGIDFIRKNFVDLSEVINAIKDGDYETANTLLRRADKGNKLSTIRAQAQNLGNPTTQTVSMQAYTNALDLINNVQVTKKSDDLSSIYSLVSSYADFPAGEVNFFENLMRNVRSWVVANEEVWFNKLVEKVTKLIKKFESGK